MHALVANQRERVQPDLCVAAALPLPCVDDKGDDGDDKGDDGDDKGDDGDDKGDDGGK